MGKGCIIIRDMATAEAVLECLIGSVDFWHYLVDKKKGGLPGFNEVIELIQREVDRRGE